MGFNRGTFATTLACFLHAIYFLNIKLFLLKAMNYIYCLGTSLFTKTFLLIEIK